MSLCENRGCQRHNTLDATIEYYDPITGKWYKLCWFCEEYFKRLSYSVRNPARWRKIQIIEIVQ